MNVYQVFVTSKATFSFYMKAPNQQAADALALIAFEKGLENDDFLYDARDALCFHKSVINSKQFDEDAINEYDGSSINFGYWEDSDTLSQPTFDELRDILCEDDFTFSGISYADVFRTSN